MLPDGRRLGAHLPLGGGMVKAVERAHEIGATALQIFGDNPTAWRRRAAPPKEQPAFRARLRELDIGPVAIHAAYLVNLAGSHADFHERSVGVLAHDLASAGGFEARFVNVHAGSHLGDGRAAGAARIADGLVAALAGAGGPAAEGGAATGDGDEDAGTDEQATRPMVVIENSAGGGDSMGSTVEEIAEIADAIAARGLEAGQVGFCVDAAHAWGAGYRVSEPDEVDALIDRFDALVGLDRLVMVHLNDTRSGLGSRTDRHEHVGAGQIGPDGLRRLLVHPRLGRVTYYLETPGMDDGYDAVNVARALDLAAGRTLAPLPPEAFEVRRDRARVAPGPDESDDEPGAQPGRETAAQTGAERDAETLPETAAEAFAEAGAPPPAPGPRTVPSSA